MGPAPYEALALHNHVGGSKAINSRLARGGNEAVCRNDAKEQDNGMDRSGCLMDTREMPERHDSAVLHEIYTPAAIESIRTRAESDSGFKLLHQMLTGANEHLAVDRAHFAKCLRFAREHNGLDVDRLHRLGDPSDYAAWRAVYNELLVPYFFAKAFGLTVCFTVNPTQKGQGDFEIIHRRGRVIVEVKTPRGDDPNLEGPQDTVHWGWDEGLIRPPFLQAARQLQKGNLNLVVICTDLCAWMHDGMAFERLLYGQEIIAATFDSKTGRTGEPRTEFRLDGELLRHRPKRHTRISAVASICAGPFDDAQVMQIQFAVLHNYFASCPIPPQVFHRAEQFLPIPGKGSIKHVGQGHSTILLYTTEGWAQAIVKRLEVSIHSLYRPIRRFYWRIKMRRVARHRV
jgi:hypothetical protein